MTVPARFQGDVLGDLNGRRGRVVSSEALDGGEQSIVALVPMSEITRYAIDLRALTGGQGRFVASFDHYEELAPHLAEKLATRKPVAV